MRVTLVLNPVCQNSEKKGIAEVGPEFGSNMKFRFKKSEMNVTD